jgi:outer membrane lipopolysaccharide assembly protein LptE/RlpB
MSFLREDAAAVSGRIIPPRLKPGGAVLVNGRAEARPLQRVALRWLGVVVVMVMAGLSGCGYHQAAAATHVGPGVTTLAVPIFLSKVQGFRTEAVFTDAVVRELNTRTRYRVLTASDDADATLRGTILTETIAPLTYDASSGQTSSYLISVTASVTLTSRSGTVLYRNDAFAWRDQFQSTQDLNGSVQEDSAAVRRMGRDFATSLVSDMLESFR